MAQEQNIERVKNDVQALESQLSHQDELHAVTNRYKADLEALRAEVSTLENFVETAKSNYQLELQIIRAELEDSIAYRDASMTGFRACLNALHEDMEDSNTIFRSFSNSCSKTLDLTKF